MVIPWVSRVHDRSVKAIALYRNGSVMTRTPTLLARGSYFPWTRSVAASLSPGLDSAGYVSLPDTTSDSDGILQVFTVQPHTVAYCSLDFRIRYLCSLDGKFSTGLLATLPVPRFGHADYHLMAVSPERFVYSQCHSGVRLVERGESDTFLFPTASTRPALLLEPMVANALRSGQSRRIHQSASRHH
jgi:hypothetical protein